MGKIVFSLDFANYGGSKTVQKAFERLEDSEQLIRVACGIIAILNTFKVI